MLANIRFDKVSEVAAQVNIACGERNGGDGTLIGILGVLYEVITIQHRSAGDAIQLNPEPGDASQRAKGPFLVLGAHRPR